MSALSAVLLSPFACQTEFRSRILTHTVNTTFSTVLMVLRTRQHRENIIFLTSLLSGRLNRNVAQLQKVRISDAPDQQQTRNEALNWCEHLTRVNDNHCSLLRLRHLKIFLRIKAHRVRKLDVLQCLLFSWQNRSR